MHHDRIKLVLKISEELGWTILHWPNLFIMTHIIWI